MYDLIIIGLGPAGINACIYAKRSNLNILVFEKNMPGGTLHTIKHVDNYLGYTPMLFIVKNNKLIYGSIGGMKSQELADLVTKYGVAYEEEN